MTEIYIIETWEQGVTWLVLLIVLYAIVSGKIRYDLTAFGGLLILGILGIREPAILFSGFSSPALFTIATVLVMSAGIVESGLLSGFGKKIAGRIHTYKNQIFALFVSTGFISAFMNNVGSIGIVLPTAKRMAQRAKVAHFTFGMPIAFAAILGGSLTLIGTASNLIVSSYRFGTFGESFKMFDFFFHGIAILFSGILVLFFCHLCGLKSFKQGENSDNWNEKESLAAIKKAVPRDRKKSSIVLGTLLPIVVLTGMGIIHPAIAFGFVTLIWIVTGVLPYKVAFHNINTPIIIFLGSMFGISAALEETGALNNLIELIGPLFIIFSPLLSIFIFVLVTALFANILDNSVAAVLMAPFAVALWKTGVIPFSPDALLMAVAAGASLGIVIPTHQATIVVMDSMDFPRKTFIKTGAVIAMIGIILSSLVIYMIWC